MKEIKIIFNAERFEFLVLMLLDGVAIDWEIAHGTQEAGQIISGFYFGQPKPKGDE